MDDDDGMVANWWRPAEPCMCRSFAAACSAGGSGGMTRLEAAWGTLELRDERRSKVAMGPSACGCTRMVAELLLGHQTACMLPRSFSGVLGDSGGLCGPPWVKKLGHGGVWVFGPHTPRTGCGRKFSGLPIPCYKNKEMDEISPSLSRHAGAPGPRPGAASRATPSPRSACPRAAPRPPGRPSSVAACGGPGWRSRLYAP
jgi:hypothetical protein